MAAPSYEQIVNDGLLYTNNLQISWGSTTTLLVQNGQARDSSNTFDLFLSLGTPPLTINGAVNGLNGLDTGTLAASTMYYVHLVYDITNRLPAGCILSLSATAPVLPGGYSIFKLIGAWPTDGSTHFYFIYQVGNGGSKNYFYDIPPAVLSAGTATTFTAVSLAAVVPAFAGVARFNAAYTPNTAGNTFSIRPTGSGASAGSCAVTASGVVAAVVQDFPPFETVVGLSSGHASIDYAVHASDSLTLSVAMYQLAT